ncbi:General negative regulator of transcription subunit 4 [Leucoagaricus sp. SymC.cos]|nr:General negative regulator of transcription subunit 4 [Leucoagaricus sp. SymC.cos]
MSAARLHPSLPAPVVHAGFSVPQSKSHVLAGVQDAYWSDDEAEDAECPLCLEEMDISDLNFKPCICGYQICRFCWHHIKVNLNKRCPACRRIYTDEAVEFKPINIQDHKRLMQQKKQRERERKELDALGRRHLANVRVVQRNVVYVVGIGPRAKEELIPTLRSNEYFGQYGKINKIILVKRTPSGGGAPVVGLYITYQRKEDAARAIAAVDGTASPGGGKEVMRASYGTTKYCMAFLRGVSCTDHGCMNLHEWGDEKDCFTKEDLTTLKHTIKATESQTRTTIIKRSDDSEGLPRAASWAQKTPGITSSTGLSSSSISSSLNRPARRGGAPRQGRTGTVQATESRATQSRMGVDRKLTGTPLSQTSASRSSTPPPGLASESKSLRKDQSVRKAANSPVPSATVESDGGSQTQDQSLASPRSSTPASTQSPMLSVGSGAAAIPAVPPGLAAPLGIPSPSRPSRVATASPQTPFLSSQSSYQMSTAARALLDDVKARREAPTSAIGSSPFPDFDRTLQTLSEGDGGGFSFNFDPKLADEVEASENLGDFDPDMTIPYNGSYVDVFPSLRSPINSPHIGPPPGLSYPANHSIYDPPRENPAFYGTGGLSPNMQQSQWSPASHQEFSSSQPMSNVGSPLLQQSQAQNTFTQPGSRFQPFDAELSEAQLREFIQTSRERANVTNTQSNHPESPGLNKTQQPFQDPAIMSASFVPALQAPMSDITYGPPPGLSFPPGLNTNVMGNSHVSPIPPFDEGSAHVSTTTSPAPSVALSATDFPALSANIADPPPLNPSQDVAVAFSELKKSKAQEKAERKAAKAAAAAERAAERQRIVQEKAVAKAAEKAELTRRKAEEKERLLQAQAMEAERKKAEAERKDAEREKAEEAARLERENTARLEREAAEKARIEKEREKALRVEKEKAAAAKKAQKQAEVMKAAARKDQPMSPAPPTSQNKAAVDPIPQVPLLSKKPKKTKPATKPIRVPRDDEHLHDETSTLFSAATSEAPRLPGQTASSSRANSRSQSIERQSGRATIQDLFEQIHLAKPHMDLPNHPFFDLYKLASASKMPLEYDPLVHALSALSVGGASFSSNVPSNSIDNAVSSFQQLLETLTQTISDLLRLLPRNTWDDSSSFDGVLRDMLKSDDFLDETAEENGAKEDEVAALTLALERRARWMEVQLSKLEELHRDINNAAVRAILVFNDNGWDSDGFLPRVTNTLRRFEQIGMVDEEGKLRPMSVQELEKKSIVSKEATIFAETEVREVMEKFQGIKFESSY